MARSSRCISLVVCVFAAQHIAAQDVFTRMLATDALLSGVKKDAIQSHLQRMLQMEPEREDPASKESCSPADLAQDKKCLAQSPSGSEYKRSYKPSIVTASRTSIAAPNCKGPDCLIAPMPSEMVPTGSKDADSAPQAPARKAVAHGPMTQDAFARLVLRKRAAKTRSLSAELQAVLRTSNDQQLKDDFGIPLPSGPARPRADFEMRFQPQTPAPDPATTTSDATPTTSSAPRADFEMRFQPQTPAPDPAITTAAAATTTSSAPRADFEMRFQPQTPAPDPRLFRNELEAFIAASPALAPHRPAHTGGGIRSSSTSSGAARPPMTEQEAARLASQQAANTAVREAALARKRKMVRGEPTVVSSSNNPKNTSATTAPAAAAASSSNATVRRNATSQQQQMGQRHAASSTAFQQRRRTSSSNTANIETVRTVKRNPSSTATRNLKPAAAAASWGVLGYVLAAILALGSAVVVFVAAAVMEDVLLDQSSSAGGDWLSLTRGLWRRCCRAFAAARKQLTGHGSDLPLSANEGTGTVARAFAAASAFVHVFWTHLADHRGQHLGGAVTAALHASRRASTGSCVATAAATAVSVVPDRTSAGGACPFGASQFQQPESYIIEADRSAAATATAELNLRRRH